MSATFANPLRRETRRTEAVSFPPKFSKIFDYSSGKKSPMNSGHMQAVLSKEASTRMMDLCRSIKVSVGAGCFALAGIAMMELEEQRHPDVPDDQRQPFTAAFPLNPRAFFGFTTPADSCMLAFSDGIVMPFLPSSLPIEGRFKLIAKIANRELRMYQKRLKTTESSRAVSLDAHSPGRLLAQLYLLMLDINGRKLPADRKLGFNPQGSLPAKTFQHGATCGVSSVGPTASYFQAGKYDLSEVGVVEGKDFAADFAGFRIGVRARENEFLVGSSTNHDGIVGFGLSYDENAISEEAANDWGRKIESLLEGGHEKSKL
jgi:hypothetical protein